MVHWFWLLLCFLAILWYVLVTVVVGYKGILDIRKMARKLKNEADGDE